jgi:hypothetical protein
MTFYKQYNKFLNTFYTGAPSSCPQDKWLQVDIPAGEKVYGDVVL